MSGHALRLGFVPLNDAAPLVVAEAKGLFTAEGLSVELVREASWATVRDKVAYGALDAAQMLAPLALAMTLGVAGAPGTPVVAPMALALNGPTITLAAHLAAAIGPGPGADGLAQLVARRAAEGASPLTLAVVYPWSTHNYLLRDWLAAANLDPERDVRLTIASPVRMVELLQGGVVEGFCVSEPWDTAAVACGAGVILARGSQLWPRTPDKVLALSQTWAEANAAGAEALVRALLKAAAWADDPAHRDELAALLAQPRYLHAPVGIVRASLSDVIFFEGGANAPKAAQGERLLREMIRWRHAPADIDVAGLARRVFRTDLFAAAQAGVAS